MHKELRPATGSTIFTAVAGLFFAVFAIAYILQLTGIYRIRYVSMVDYPFSENTYEYPVEVVLADEMYK